MESENTICPICENYFFEFPDDYDICPICGWENDGLQRDKRDYWGGANTLSVNEAKLVYNLSKNDSTKSKISDIIEEYQRRNNEIRTKYKEINHTTMKGKRCREAFAQAHNDFVTALNKLV